MSTSMEKIVLINNKRYEPVGESEEKVLIEGRNSPVQAVGAGMVGRFMVENFGYEPIIVYSQFNANVLELFKSFGFTKFKQTKPKRLLTIAAHPWLFLKSIFITVTAIFQMGLHRDDIFENFSTDFKVCGMCCGDLIYDTYIRYEHRYMNLRKDLLLFWRMIFYCAFEINLTNLLFNSFNINKVVITAWDYCYIGSYLSRLAFNKGIPVVIVSGNMVREFQNDSVLPNYPSVVCLKASYLIEYAPDIKSNIEHYLKRYFAGDVDYNSANSFKDKVVLSRKELLGRLNISHDNRKIVFIMPHCFSDAVHAGGHILFRDYYDWFIQTLNHIRKNDSVIWIVRPHPGSYMYGESGIVDKIVEEKETSNIFLCPKNTSTETVLKTADSVITVNGTIGIEAAIFGIPAVVSGTTAYGNYGLVREPTSKEEYFKILDRIHTLEKLSDKKINLARKVFFLYHFDYRFESDILFRPSIPPGLTNEEKEAAQEQICERLYKNILTKRYEEDNYYKSLNNVIS